MNKKVIAIICGCVAAVLGVVLVVLTRSAALAEGAGTIQTVPFALSLILTVAGILAIIIPPSRKSRIIAGLVAISFALSFAASRLPVISALSGGTRTIILTVILSAAAAILFPVREEEGKEEQAQ